MQALAFLFRLEWQKGVGCSCVLKQDPFLGGERGCGGGAMVAIGRTIMPDAGRKCLIYIYNYLIGVNEQ